MAGLFGNVSAEGGFDQSEIDFVTQLISSGQTTIDDVSKTFGVPTDVIASVYAENAPKFASPAPLITAPVSAPTATLTPTVTAPVVAANQESLFNDIILSNNILGSIGNIYGNAKVAPAAPVSNQGYQSPYALNAAEPSNVNLGQVAGGTNTAIQGLADFNIADSAGSAAAASDVFAGGLGSVIGAVSGQESKAETAGLGALSALGLINPAAALAYRLFDAFDLFGGGGLKATPMTPEEALKYAGESRLATTLQGAGEGAGELILDAIQQAEAAGVTPEQIAETLNTRGDLASELIGLTVGSNQMLSEADLAAAQAEAATDPLGGSTSSLESDGDLTGDLDTIFDSTASAASTAGTGATVVNTDAEHPWLYEGNGVLRNVFTGEVETNQSGTENLVVGETYSSGTPTEATTRSNDTTDSGNINITLTPSIGGGTTSTVVTTPTTGTADTAVVDGGGGVGDGVVTITNGNGVETTTGTAAPKSTDPTLTVGTPTVTPAVTPTPTVINGVDGVDGADGVDGVDGVAGADGQDGKDGRDGRDGLTGLLTLNSIATPIADEIFTSEFKMDYLKPEFIGLLDLTRGRTV